jgi:hypothetical protein
MNKQPNGRQMFQWLEPIPLAPMQSIRKCFGGITVNDIATFAIGRAVWRHMSQQADGQDRSGELASPSEKEVEFKGRKVDTKQWTLSETAAMSLRTTVPEQLGNQVGGCRFTNPKPLFLSQGEHTASSSQTLSIKETQLSIVKDLLAKRDEIRFQAQTLKVGVAMNIASSMIANVFPVAMAKHIIRQRRTSTYGLTNVRALPVTISWQGLPLTKIVALPQFVGEIGKQ